MEYLLYDMDQVLLRDRRIIRVMGNFSSDSHFLGFNVYSPKNDGDRVFQGARYVKNYLEEQATSTDARETYEIFAKDTIVKVYDPIKMSPELSNSYNDTIWYLLYVKLVALFGVDSVGTFGSALSGLHLRDNGLVRNDIDFFIEGLENVTLLRTHMEEVRQALGFNDYSDEALQNIYTECSHVFKNHNNSLDKIIQRRWSGMELSRSNAAPIRNTIRFRDKRYSTPLELVTSDQVLTKNAVIMGRVKNAIRSNLYPRAFTIAQDGREQEVACLWWKFSSPVADNDEIIVCGDLITIDNEEVLRISHFIDHYLKILD